MKSMSISQGIGLGIGLAYVVGALTTHVIGIQIRLWRVRRLNRAGRLDEAYRVLDAVEASHQAFFRRHPGWSLAADRGREGLV